MPNYGLRWRQWDARGRLQNKQRYFEKEVQRERFEKKIREDGNFYELVAYCNPVQQEAVAEV